MSLWLILLVAFATGLLSGFLGVSGGFIRMPAPFHLVGVPVPLAVGTDLFEIVFSGGIGSFLYAQSGGVDLSTVAPLLVGSALGARLGAPRQRGRRLQRRARPPRGGKRRRGERLNERPPTNSTVDDRCAWSVTADPRGRR